MKLFIDPVLTCLVHTYLPSPMQIIGVLRDKADLGGQTGATTKPVRARRKVPTATKLSSTRE